MTEDERVRDLGRRAASGDEAARIELAAARDEATGEASAFGREASRLVADFRDKSEEEAPRPVHRDYLPNEERFASALAARLREPRARHVFFVYGLPQNRERMHDWPHYLGGRVEMTGDFRDEFYLRWRPRLALLLSSDGATVTIVQVHASATELGGAEWAGYLGELGDPGRRPAARPGEEWKSRAGEPLRFPRRAVEDWLVLRSGRR